MWRCKKTEPVPEDVRKAAGVLERRYAVTILFASHAGCTRFNEFRQAVGEIPPGTLAQRLLELEQAGVLTRVVTDARPPRVEYRAQPFALLCEHVLDALAGWARA